MGKQEKESDDSLTPELKLAVQELVEKRIDKFVGGIQKVTIALSIILGFIGWRSCTDMRTAIKEEVKKDLVKDALFTAIKTDVAETELESVLGNLRSKIIEGELEDDDLQNLYLDLFSEFFESDEVKSINIIKTLSTAEVPDKSAAQITKLVESIKKLVKHTSNNELRHECLMFLISFSSPEYKTELIAEIEKIQADPNSPLRQYLDEYLLKLGSTISIDNQDGMYEGQIHKTQIARLISLSKMLVSQKEADPISALGGFITIIENEQDAQNRHLAIADLQKFLKSDQTGSHLGELISILLRKGVLDRDGWTASVDGDEGIASADDTSLAFNLIEAMRDAVFAEIKSSRDAYIEGSVRGILRTNEEFYKGLFYSLYKNNGKSEEDKIEIIKFFISNSRRRGSRYLTTVDCRVKIKSEDLVTSVYLDDGSRRLMYVDEAGKKKVLDVNDIEIVELVGPRLEGQGMVSRKG
ncbi:hypothetical protein SAMN04488109_1356 [Chryseolinea serpens]|uniref:Uncharacterized protein n=1 Tax=Chryseolinea serpens TaxID=947013 RepID=A0A1M5LR42_9BACT|nr:hypothetical protein [Chryseolinea serpens]SHG67612.1 hypothetical protein SAMN04488109_1356 [Chryseolinea serpens]